MSLLRLLVAALASAAGALPALAQDPELSPQYAACMEKAGGVTLPMIECIVAEHGRQDRRLNAAFQALVSDLTPARRKQLQSAQRLWIQYRDANCDFYHDPDGGSLARVAANACHLRMTALRAQELVNLKPIR
ncbi:lysozyme inhibitor LprI family protein [Pantoea sp. 18069]|uniref:lysozyme inhibitor LprI family protein n=1 Tax=Pantoea sp. 18069 TaxID=2681415 RepID=UPI00190F2D43|nr:lysozyme inhibitor LprI family protein [Pantoea sp. 18069]